MGGQCSGGSNLREDFEVINQFDHEAFGKITLMKNVGKNFSRLDEVALKEYSFTSIEDQDSMIASILEAKSYQNIPTLLKIYSYDKLLLSNTKAISSCSSPYRLNLYFSYLPNTLRQHFAYKRSLHTDNKIPNVKLGDYHAIDRLNHQQRRILNGYFQEVQVLRMIDHIIGALYFLNHFGISYSAIKPQYILIDSEGKYVLPDPRIFQLQSNYSVALQTLINQKSISYRELQYLSPQLLPHLKQKHARPHENIQKVDIFSVGILALEMCLIDQEIHKKMLDEHNLKLNRTQLNKLLIACRNRYSESLVDLIRTMVESDLKKRVGYSQLIDILNPQLTKNIQQIQEVYGGNQKMKVTQESSGLKSVELLEKLSEIEYKFHQIMNQSRFQLSKPPDVNLIKSQQQQILQKLKKIGGYKPKNQEIKGSDLYDIYLHEYQAIKQTRPK